MWHSWYKTEGPTIRRITTGPHRALFYWRREKGFSSIEAARYLGLGLREYQLYEVSGWTLRDVPVREQPIFPA